MIKGSCTSQKERREREREGGRMVHVDVYVYVSIYYIGHCTLIDRFS